MDDTTHESKLNESAYRFSYRAERNDKQRLLGREKT